MKIFEILLYIALLAFVFSGYVIFAGDFSKFAGNAIVDKNILLEDSLLAEYLRWNIYKKFNSYYINGANGLLNNSTSTILNNLSRISREYVKDFNYSIAPIASDENFQQSAQFYLDNGNSERTFSILLP